MEVITPILPTTTKKLDKLKTNAFYCIHQKTEVAGQIAILTYETRYSESQLIICLPGIETSRAINWEEHLNGNYDKLLEAECALESG